MKTTRSAVAAAALLAGCAPALREPAPLVAPASPGPSASVEALLARADAAWARRSEPEAAREAERLYAAAAATDASGVAGLLGVMRARAFLIEREPDAIARGRLAASAVEAGQWCQRRAPGAAACDYGLAIALGQQAREHLATAQEALRLIPELLRRVIAAEPGLDGGGPHRVLAWLLLRAPGWPIGPGDPDAAVLEARAALALFPDRADNRLAYAEALAKTEHEAEAREAYTRALESAEQEARAGDPDAVRWVQEARAGLGAPRG